MPEKLKKGKQKVIDIRHPSEKNEKKEQKEQEEREELEIKVVKKEVPEKDLELSKENFEEEKEESDKETFYSELYPLRFEEIEEKKEKIFFLNFLKKKQILIIVGFLVLGALFYYLSFFVFAKAEVLITTNKTESKLSSKIVLDANANSINYEKGIIPASMFTFKQNANATFKATGKGKDEKKATGVVTLINNYSTSPQVLVATTRLETPDGKIFRLDSRTIIPGAKMQDGKLIPSSVEAKVTADQPGEEYNIDPCDLPNCKFSIVGFKGTPKYEGFYAISKQPMTGGKSGMISMITAEDMTNAEAEILKEIIALVNQAIETKLKELKDLSYIPEGKSGIKLTNLKADAEIGDFRETFNISAEGEVRLIAFKQSDLINYIQKTHRKR